MPSSLFLTALDLAAGLEPAPANLHRVARETDEAAARWAFGQWELRERARRRFPDADRMLFVREALEQATHAELATYHAGFFPPGEPVVDLTLGIGGDGLALAARGPLLGFEIDPERADLARWNLAVRGLSGEVREEDGLAWLREHGAPYVLADPARRVDGRRTLDPGDFKPDPFAVAATARDARRWLMKLTPMLPDETLTALAPRVEFVSFEGECREALLVGGSKNPLSPPGGSAEGGDAKRLALSTGVASQVERGQEVRGGEGFWATHPTREPLRGGTSVPQADAPDAWLHDADPAAVRAHALGGFGLRALGDTSGYLTGPERVDSPWLRAYRVVDDVAPKRLRAALHALGSAAPILKQRGARQDLDRWRRELGRHGERPLAVAFYVRGAAVRASILEP